MLSLLSAVLGLAKIIAQIAHDNKLMDAGEAKAISENLTNAMETIRKARVAQSAVRNDPAERERVRDKYRDIN